MANWILITVIVLFLLRTIFIYNRLVALRNEVKNAWHQIDVQLKRRYDLIPNLVTIVKGYTEFERDTLERVTAARTRAISAVKNVIRQLLKTCSLRHWKGFSQLWRITLC